MDQLAEFAVNNWMLVTAFFVVLGLLIANLFTGVGGVGPQDAVRMINRDGAVAVDVRPQADFDAGHIIDAVHLPAAELPQGLERLKKHRDKPLIVYCASGGSAAQAVRKLKAAGFDQAQALRGGIAAWRSENLPVTSG